MRQYDLKFVGSLEENNFSGQVPAQLGELTKLKVSIDMPPIKFFKVAPP